VTLTCSEFQADHDSIASQQSAAKQGLACSGSGAETVLLFASQLVYIIGDNCADFELRVHCDLLRFGGWLG